MKRPLSRQMYFRRVGVALGTLSLCLGVWLAAHDESSISISTDSSEYVAGDLVTISGGGFSPFEDLTLRVLHADGSAEPEMGHEAVTHSADEGGTFTANWSIAATDEAGNDFVVQVTGATSGDATAAFRRVAKVKTDRSDYQPGETTIITGSEFAPFESVTLHVTHLTGGEDGGDGHEPFSVTTDEAGRLMASWYVNPDDSRGSTFLLTAIGQTSERTASTTFTDAVGTPPDSTADVVFGQLGSFTTGALNAGGLSADSLWAPGDVVADRDGNVYVPENGTSRVLFYPAGSTSATRVYGQNGSFTTGFGNNGGISANSLLHPEGVALDGDGNLYVADFNNNRVLFYPAGSTTATRVYGQGGDLTKNLINSGHPTFVPNANSLWAPYDAVVDRHGNLYVADVGNNRILFYPAGTTIPTRVYGQGGSYTSGGANSGGRSPDSLWAPWGIALDGNDNLYVADRNNQRVLFFLEGSTTATRVYGQAGNFTTATASTTASGLAAPEGVALDRQGNLFVADRGNNRVLFFPAGSTTATHVYGQLGSFTTAIPNKGGRSADSLAAPKNLSLDRLGNLYVVDRVNHRVLKYDRFPDTVPPTAAPSQSPVANPAGWNNSDVTVDWNWTDEDSGTGIDDEHCTMSSTSSGEGLTITLEATCQDLAGNMATATHSVSVDKTAPVVAAVTQSPAENAAGWNNTDVTVAWTWSDAGSGIDMTNCTVSGTSSGEGDTIALDATCHDVAGNATTDSYSVRIDKTPPMASPTQLPAPNGAGWNNTDVTVSWNWADAAAGSGTDPTTCTAGTTTMGEGDPIMVEAVCTDVAGNTGSASYAVKVDKTAPLVAIVGGPVDGGSYAFGSVPAAPSCSASDSLAGVESSCTVAGYSAEVGTHTVTATAVDRAGNQGSVPVTYTVTSSSLTLSGFFAPVDIGGVWNTVKGGATVPLKFEVFDGLTELTDTAIVHRLTAADTSCGAGETDEIEVLATGATSLRYDTVGGHFIFNWQTPKIRSCYVVTVGTIDGSTLTAYFRLR